MKIGRNAIGLALALLLVTAAISVLSRGPETDMTSGLNDDTTSSRLSAPRPEATSSLAPARITNTPLPTPVDPMPLPSEEEWEAIEAWSVFDEFVATRTSVEDVFLRRISVADWERLSSTSSYPIEPDDEYFAFAYSSYEENAFFDSFMPKEYAYPEPIGVITVTPRPDDGELHWYAVRFHVADFSMAGFGPVDPDPRGFPPRLEDLRNAGQSIERPVP